MTENTAAANQEIEAADGYGVAKLAGRDLRIKAVGQWRPSYLRALRLGDYDTWAEGALHEDDVQIFIDTDATFDEINEFTSAAMEASGEAPGKSGGPSKSSRSTRRR
ncbi:hypothetical protein OG709_29870 [Streptomyces sp. NBC_01267]|uniref:hypothetical protein n=1 Tax=Streptomyces sp. NBC_01267 TaxID=2903805 RepID=UPI002E344ABF|nr:hypothetical protein [Streptomyces sp. NBC_01267]